MYLNQKIRLKLKNQIDLIQSLNTSTIVTQVGFEFYFSFRFSFFFSRWRCKNGVREFSQMTVGIFATVVQNRFVVSIDSYVVSRVSFSSLLSNFSLVFAAHLVLQGRRLIPLLLARCDCWTDYWIPERFVGSLRNYSDVTNNSACKDIVIYGTSNK